MAREALPLTMSAAKRSVSPRPPPLKRQNVKDPLLPPLHAKLFRWLSVRLKRLRLTKRQLQAAFALLVFAALYVARRQFLLPNVFFPDSPPASHDAHQNDSRQSSPSILQWPHPQSNFPPEDDPPDPSLYGTGKERCYAIGQPQPAAPRPPKGHPASFWQMNSRALCYSERPICIYGRTMRNLLSFEEQGAGSCSVLSVNNATVSSAASVGLNESCAAFRTHFVSNMFGREVFRDYDQWHSQVTADSQDDALRKPIGWQSDFAIVIPKYSWSYNICHYNRIWNFVIYVLRNLKLFAPDSVASIKHVDILFRAGYHYDEHWHTGLREATVPALEKELGISISVGKLRYNYKVDYQCIRRGILLGEEGRVDAFPFFNDTPIWDPRNNIDDTHWPTIPHDSLWLRDTVLAYGGYPKLHSSPNGPPQVYDSIPVPPRKIVVLLRSPRSKRRLTLSGKRWLDVTLRGLAKRYDMKVEYVRTSGAMTLTQQIGKIRDAGIAIGIHGANMVNTVFMPPGGAFFEIFPWRYVRFYYVSGANSGLRYSFHEPEGGIQRDCTMNSSTCFFKYRESLIYLTERDRRIIEGKLDKAVSYVAQLNRRYPERIPLTKIGNTYHFSP